MAENLPTGATSYALRSAFPVRPLIISAVLIMLGLVGCLVGVHRENTALMVIGIVLLVLALAFTLIGVFATLHNSIHVDLDAQGFRVHGPGLDKSGSWSEVTRVATTPDGNRLVIASGPVVRTYIIAPLGGADPQMKALIDDIGRRMVARSLT